MALTTKEQLFFRDIPLAFRINPISNDISIAKNEDAVKKALINLLGTKVGTRPFRPDFGVDIEKYLFEVADYETEVDINKEIGRAIQEYEPRVRLITIDSTIQENNGVKVVITYTVAGFSRVQTLETTVTTRVK
jgi:phage baseplate assembly protein W